MPGMSSSPAVPSGSFKIGSHTAHVLLFVTPALWCVNYLVARWAPGVVAPHALALGRWAIAAALLALFCREELMRKRAAIRVELPRLFILGALGMWVCGAFVYIGGRTTGALNIGLIYAVSPVLIAWGSALVLRERLGPAQIAGIVLAIAGVLHILVKGRWAALAELRFTPGDLWIAVASVCWAAYSLLLRIWPSAFSPVGRLTLIAAAGVVVLLPFSAIEAAAGVPTELSWRSFGLVLAAALVPGVLAYGAYSLMQRELGAARVGLVLYLGPLYSAVLAWGVLDEQLHGFHLIGALLILPGIWLASRR